tara:strand:- start:130 stop:1461 length:1332 start_codon:yes stop_codon:yes gene_type:complete
MGGWKLIKPLYNLPNIRLGLNQFGGGSYLKLIAFWLAGIKSLKLLNYQNRLIHNIFLAIFIYLKIQKSSMKTDLYKYTFFILIGIVISTLVLANGVTQSHPLDEIAFDESLEELTVADFSIADNVDDPNGIIWHMKEISDQSLLFKYMNEEIRFKANANIILGKLDATHLQLKKSGLQAYLRKDVPGTLEIQKEGGLTQITGPTIIGDPDNVNQKSELRIIKAIDADANNEEGFIILGNSNAENLALDPNEIMARNNKAPSTLFIQNDGGNTILNKNGGKVGIGTSTIEAILHIDGSNSDQAKAVANVLRLESNDDSGTLARFYNKGISMGLIEADHIKKYFRVIAIQTKPDGNGGTKATNYDLILDGTNIQLNAPVSGLSASVNYDECTVKDISDKAGGSNNAGDVWKAQCPTNRVMVGIWDGGSGVFGDIDRIKCCRLKVS